MMMEGEKKPDTVLSVTSLYIGIIIFYLYQLITSWTDRCTVNQCITIKQLVAVSLQRHFTYCLNELLCISEVQGSFSMN